jgi:hypothetical protein
MNLIVDFTPFLWSAVSFVLLGVLSDAPVERQIWYWRLNCCDALRRCQQRPLCRFKNDLVWFSDYRHDVGARNLQKMSIGTDYLDVLRSWARHITSSCLFAFFDVGREVGPRWGVYADWSSMLSYMDDIAIFIDRSVLQRWFLHSHCEDMHLYLTLIVNLSPLSYLIIAQASRA